MQVSNFIVKNKKKHFKSKCSICGVDRGYQLPKYMDRLCRACSAQQRAVNNSKKYMRYCGNCIVEIFCKKCSSWYPTKDNNWKVSAHGDPTLFSSYSCNRCRIAKAKINRIKRSDHFCMSCGVEIGNDTKNKLCRACFLKNQGSFRKKAKPRSETYSYRYKNDGLYRLDKCIRSLIYRSLRGHKLKKTTEYLGCSIPELKKHLESQFQEGMSWDNYGRNGWHIDHIVPSSSASTEEELIKLQHYSNLQPLWETENLKKGSKLES